MYPALVEKLLFDVALGNTAALKSNCMTRTFICRKPSRDMFGFDDDLGLFLRSLAANKRSLRSTPFLDFSQSFNLGYGNRIPSLFHGVEDCQKTAQSISHKPNRP